MPHDASDSYFAGAEIVLGLTAPVGTDFSGFAEHLAVVLQQFRYEGNMIRLGELALNIRSGAPEPPPTGTPEYQRLTRLMNVGNEARRRGGTEILALAAAARVLAERPEVMNGQRAPRPRTAHVLRSLKHPSEVHALRRIYGPGFFLIGIVASEEERRSYLRAQKGCTDQEIDELLRRDDREPEEFGQRTRDTFHLSDAFIGLVDNDELSRFLGLIFGSPHITPTPDEYAMFLAFSAALRSGDLSRQVGAVVTSARGDIVAVGANEVPIAGGGLCWPGEHDHRDHKRGEDMNQSQRKRIIDEILAALRPHEVAEEQWLSEGWKRLRTAAVMDITEYGRAVHAEMEALLACTRSGASPIEGSLFSTTFPCHNCAKHTLAAGIKRVVYVEPYTKSQAIEMYPESIATTPRGGRVVLFEAFRGVGPRRFFDLFSVGISTGYPVKRKENGKPRAWQPSAAEIRVPLVPNSYIAREKSAAERLRALVTPEDESHEQADP